MPTIPIILPNDEQLKVINSELSIDEERHKGIVQAFKNWLKSEPHLPDDIDERYISHFIKLCKDNLVKAKTKFELNIVLRSRLVPDQTFVSRKILRESDFVRQCICLPKLTPDGYRIVYGDIPTTVERYDIKAATKFAMDIIDIVLMYDLGAGSIIISDCGNCTLDFVSKLNFTLFSNFLTYLVRSIPTRVKNFHFLNIPTSAKPLLALTKAALPDKLRNRMVFHEDAESLKKYIPEDLLPKDVGGQLKTVKELAEDWERFYVEEKEWKEEMGKFRLRGEIPKDRIHLDPASGFGTDGTFRSLQVD